jgi:hypothetical protein
MMLQRCSNMKFYDYAKRGITVCERWKSFQNFLADMGDRPVGKSLDRFPNKNGNYEPNNCRWATPSEQMNNSRQNITVELNGQILTITQWARRLGIHPDTLRWRHKHGRWPE